MSFRMQGQENGMIILPPIQKKIKHYGKIFQFLRDSFHAHTDDKVINTKKKFNFLIPKIEENFPTLHQNKYCLQWFR